MLFKNVPVSRFTVSFLILCALPFLTCSCAKKNALSDEELQRAEEIRLPLVQLCEVKIEEGLRPQTFSAIAKEGKTIQLSFRVPGPMISMTAKIGELVEKDAELAHLDQRDFQNSLATVNASLAEVQAGLDAKTANKDRTISMLQKQVDAAVAQFETVDKNLKKFQDLEKDGAVPEIKLDEVKLQHEQALAAKIAAEKQLENGIKGLEEEIKGYEAKKEGLLAQKKQAEDALADTILRAPCGGYVTQKYAEQGEIIVPAVPVLAFTDASEILVQTTIPESFLVREDEFASFECVFEAYPEKKMKAEQNSLGKALQAGGHGYPLEVKVQNDENLPIYPGMAANVTIYFQPKEGECLVPLTSVVGDYVEPSAETSGKKYDGKSRETIVWTLSPENKVLKKNVKIIRLVPEGVIVSGDLKPGDLIVGPGARFLREGQTVRTRQEERK